MALRTPGSRRSGLLVPLFSIPSTRSWGIGEICDVEPLARWLDSGGQRVLQLLPITETPPSETSPYSALSAMAIDPTFITIDALEDFAAVGGEEGLDANDRALLADLRVAPAIRYDDVRRLKDAALRRSFGYFRGVELPAGTRRASSFGAFVRDQSWWLEDYALFRALFHRFEGRPWTDWPDDLRSRQPHALDRAREELRDEILYRQYLQWVAGDQWASVRARAGDVAIFGDMPFMVSANSADVWANQDEFRMDASAGVPPDAFSDTGQDWQLPVYRWDVIASRDFDWLRARARRYADLYDGYRVDHLVGFYRTYFRPHDGGEPAFTPAGEDEQRQLGERVLAVFREPGAEIIAEDLGTVPDFVRASLTRLDVPGYKVFRWERQWHEHGQPFNDPAQYPPAAVATSGTHDTEPMAVWWESAPREEREAVLALGMLRDRLADEDRHRAVESPDLPHPLREALLEVLFASGAALLLLPFQDVFGWRDRINVPATIGDGNWTWRLPWPVDRLTTQPDAMAVATQLREWAQRHGRL